MSNFIEYLKKNSGKLFVVRNAFSAVSTNLKPTNYDFCCDVPIDVGFFIFVLEVGKPIKCEHKIFYPVKLLQRDKLLIDWIHELYKIDYEVVQ
jgi:hypothetical protein